MRNISGKQTWLFLQVGHTSLPYMKVCKKSDYIKEFKKGALVLITGEQAMW